MKPKPQLGLLSVLVKVWQQEQINSPYFIFIDRRASISIKCKCWQNTKISYRSKNDCSYRSKNGCKTQEKQTINRLVVGSRSNELSPEKESGPCRHNGRKIIAFYIQGSKGKMSRPMSPSNKQSSRPSCSSKHKQSLSYI